MILINYANQSFRESQKLNCTSARDVGLFDRVISYSPGDISRDFYLRHKRILVAKRGNGFWLWKPYFILETMLRMKDGEVLLYCDSGSYFVGSALPLKETLHSSGQDILCFDSGYLEKEYTKKNCFILMGCDQKEYGDTQHRIGSFIMLKKSPMTMDFASEYLKYSCVRQIICDDEQHNKETECAEFKAHRHDQSIFSLLTKKYQLEGYRDPSQYGNSCKEKYPNSPYGQIIEHTRHRSAPKSQFLRLPRKIIREIFIGRQGRK